MKRLLFFRDQQNNSSLFSAIGTAESDIQEKKYNQKKREGDQNICIYVGKVIHKDLFFRSNIKQSDCNSSKKKNSVKYKQGLGHKSPFSAKNSENQPFIRNTINPDDTTNQSILSMEKEGIITETTDTTAKLPNIVESALNLDSVKCISSVLIKLINLSMFIRINSQLVRQNASFAYCH